MALCGIGSEGYCPQPTRDRLVGGLLRRRDRHANKPPLDGGARVTPLQKPRQPPGSTARTG